MAKKIIKCKVCGMDINLHDKWLMNAHNNMQIAHIKANKVLKSYKFTRK